MAVQPPPEPPARRTNEQQTGVAAAIAIIATIIGWIVLFAAYPGWSFFLQIIAVIAGIIGLMMAASPRVGGGVASIVGVIAGAIGIIFAILGMVGALFV